MRYRWQLILQLTWKLFRITYIILYVHVCMYIYNIYEYAWIKRTYIFSIELKHKIRSRFSSPRSDSPTNFLFLDPAAPVLSRVLPKRIINCTLRSWINGRRIISTETETERIAPNGHERAAFLLIFSFLLPFSNRNTCRYHMTYSPLGSNDSKLFHCKIVSFCLIIRLRISIKLQWLSGSSQVPLFRLISEKLDS